MSVYSKSLKTNLRQASQAIIDLCDFAETRFAIWELCHKFIHDPKNMVYSILNQWEFSKKLVIIEGTSEKAFCAGGDVKSLALALSETKDLYLIEETFRQGYILNHLIGTYNKSYIAIINEITMEGGVGLYLANIELLRKNFSLCYSRNGNRIISR